MFTYVVFLIVFFMLRWVLFIGMFRFFSGVVHRVPTAGQSCNNKVPHGVQSQLGINYNLKQAEWSAALTCLLDEVVTQYGRMFLYFFGVIISCFCSYFFNIYSILKVTVFSMYQGSTVGTTNVCVTKGLKRLKCRT